MKPLYRTFTLFLLMITLLTACGQFSIGFETQIPETLPPAATYTPQPPSIESVEATKISTPAPEDEQTSGAQFWTTVTDPAYGFSFAVPCFWRVSFPQDYEPGVSTSYQVYNYPEDYPLSFPRGQGVFENGGIKLDFGINNLASDGMSAGTTLETLAASEMYNDDLSEVTSIEPVKLNSLTAVLVTQQNKESGSTGQFYLVALSSEVVLLFAPAPAEAINNPDVQAILNSITMGEQTAVQLPDHVPGHPPDGLAAACIPQYSEAVIPTLVLTVENTTCGPQSFKSLDYLVQTVEQYLQDRNTGGLVYEYFIPDPFMIGYWKSEGLTLTPNEVFGTLANSLYNAAQPGGMTFTTDRSQFPSLEGINPETLIDPQLTLAQIVFSTGWGQDGLGEALLFIVQDECGGYFWHGLVFAGEGFNPSPPPAVTIPDDLDCMKVTEATPLEWIVCNVRDGIRSGNLAALPSFMTDAFALGYWRSEWTSLSPDEVMRELQYNRLPVDKSKLVFSANPDRFPELDGQSIYGMLGPDVKIARVVYSQGWGHDRAGAALLFFSEPEPGVYEWAGLLLSDGYFDE